MATDTLMDILTTFSTRQGLELATSVNTADETTLQCVGLLNEVLEDLTTRPTFHPTEREATWTLIAGEVQGDIVTMTGDEGALGIRNRTMYNKTLRLMVDGPLSPQAWAATKNLQIVAPNYRFRMMNGNVQFYPAVSGAYVGQQVYFEYLSTAVVFGTNKAKTGTVFKNYFTDDADTCILPTQLLVAGLRWKWRAEKGLEYAEQFRHYETLIASLYNKMAQKPLVRMDEETLTARPAIVIPPGNWNLS